MEHLLFSSKPEQGNGSLILHTNLVEEGDIASLIVSSCQQNRIDMKLGTWSPFMVGTSTHTLPSFSIPNSKPSIFLFSYENQVGAFILGREHFAVSDNFTSLDHNSISLVVTHNLYDTSSSYPLKTSTKVLKEGDVEDFYGAAVKNDKWIACYKEIGNEHKKCLVGSIDWSDGSVSAVVSAVSLNRLPKSVINGQKKMGRDCSVREMKIEGVVSGPHSEVDFFVTVLADCYSEVQFPYSIKIFQISSLGKLRGYLHVEEMEYSSAIQTMITSSNNLVMCRDKFSQYHSGTIQPDAEGMWNLNCHEFGLQSNATLQFLGTMRVGAVEGSIANSPPFQHLRFNDFAGAHVKVSDYVAGSKVRWDEHNLTNILSYVEIGEAGMRVENVFFQSPAIGDFIVESSYIKIKSYVDGMRSANIFISAENRDKDNVYHKNNVCHVFTSNSGKIEWTCRRIEFSLKTGKYSLSIKETPGENPFNGIEGFDVTSEGSITLSTTLFEKTPAIAWEIDSGDSEYPLPDITDRALEADSDGMGNDRDFVFVDDDYALRAVESSASSGAGSMFFFPIAMMAMAAVNIANFYF